MIRNNQAREALREIPSVDEIIDQFQDSIKNAPYTLHTNTIRETLDSVRREIRQGKLTKNIKRHTFQLVETALNQVSKTNIKNVINGTGIILHTGLGRAPLSRKLIRKAMESIYPYTNLEVDLQTGKRGERTHHVEALIQALTGSEASIVLNNNAAAVLLMLNTLSEGKEVIISRGQQVEIGGSFRIPDVILKSGCKMVEVGTTNKTHLKDYQDAITQETGAILVAHTSNYKVMGFTHSVDLSELSDLAWKKRIPLLIDLGSGAVANFKNINLPHEPSVLSYVKSAAGVFSFSGDKLLGGPQAGIICGKKTLIRKIHQNPMYRALRCDKFTYAILEETLRSYLTPTNIHTENLTMNLFRREPKKLKKIAEKILKKLPEKVVRKYGIKIRQTEVEAGSGSLPLEKISSISLVFNGKIKASELSRKFRMADPSVLGYINGSCFHIDLKAIPSDQEKLLLKTLQNILV